jgi:inosose dehydratase
MWLRLTIFWFTFFLVEIPKAGGAGKTDLAVAVPFGQMLDELRETGYAGSELGDWGYMPTDAGVLRSELERRGVAMVGAFVPVALRHADAHARGESRAVRVARLLAETSGAAGEAGPLLILADDNGTDPIRTAQAGHITPHLGLSAKEWETFARGAERIAQIVREETGLRTAFHHHCAGYVETPEETARLLALTDAQLLGLVFDTGHMLFGSRQNDGQVIIETLERFAGRIWHVHFKDCQPQVAARARSERWDYFMAVRHGLFCELGKGAVPFPAVVDWLRAHHYQGWIVVEQDVLPGMGSPKASAQRNRDYLRSIGL